MENIIFAVAGIIVLAGALGVVLSRNTVYSAMSLVATLFGVAVLFLTLAADFLAAVQVIVYAGAVVVLFLFVIMLLGVDRLENLRTDPLVGQRWAGIALSVLIGAGLLFVVLVGTITGGKSSAGEPTGRGGNVYDIAKQLFSDYLIAFEITSLLLVIGVVGAVALARRARSDDELIDTDEPVVDLARDDQGRGGDTDEVDDENDAVEEPIR